MTDASGIPISDGNVSMTSALFDAASGGKPLRTETRTVTVPRRIFNANLGSAKQLMLPFDRPFRLGISVNGGRTCHRGPR